MNPEATVFVVDDDADVRRSLRRLMESVRLRVETYDSARAFLEQYAPARPGCLILDVRMPGMSGLELQQALAERAVSIPIIIVSAHADVEKVVRAIKSGAVDFLQKPYKAKVLLERVHQALALDAQRRRTDAERAGVAARLALLTPREREVMERLATGQSSKQIALELGLSRKTVDIHRQHVMLKLGAETAVDLARIAQVCAARPGGDSPPPPHGGSLPPPSRPGG